MTQMSILLFLLLYAVSATAQLFPQLGGQRVGVASLTFLKLDNNPRSAALAGSNVCLTGDAYSHYTNPAAMSETEAFTLAASHTFWAADIKYAYLSAIQPTKVGHFALSLSGLNSGAMPVRTTFQPGGTGEYFYATYFTAGLGYSQQLTDQFHYGLTAKFVQERLAEFQASTAVFDLGFLYKTDTKENIRFAVLVENFGFSSTLSGNIGEKQDSAFNSKSVSLEAYPVPTIFKLGISFQPWRSEDGTQSLTGSLQLNHPNDNSENLRLGLEYEYRNLLFLRAGYKINVEDQHYPTAGLGLRMRLGRNPMYFDYAFDPLVFLGVIHRVGLRFEIIPRK